VGRFSEDDVVAAIRATFKALGVCGEDDDDDASRIDDLLATHVATDIVVEGVDFDRALYPLRFAGLRALAQNLSDLYACDAEPLGFLWGLALPESTTLQDVRAFSRGAAELAAALGVPLLGGDVSKTAGPMVCAITVLGRAPAIAVTRRGAREGQGLWLTRVVGASAAGLRVLFRDRPGGDEGAFAAWHQALSVAERRAVDAHIQPNPAHHLERISDFAVAAIDVSDGLLRDAKRLATSSGVAVDLDAVDDAIDQAAGATRDDALGGGEDYAILMVVPDGLVPDGAIRVGRVVAGAAGGVFIGGVRVDDVGGYDHFSP
jgi:thiamine-monophosphate kinase